MKKNSLLIGMTLALAALFVMVCLVGRKPEVPVAEEVPAVAEEKVLPAMEDKSKEEEVNVAAVPDYAQFQNLNVSTAGGSASPQSMSAADFKELIKKQRERANGWASSGASKNGATGSDDRGSDPVLATRRMIAAHAQLRDPSVADPDAVGNQRAFQTMITKALSSNQDDASGSPKTQ